VIDRALLITGTVGVGKTTTVVRLVAPRTVIEARLRRRHVGPAESDLDWHLERAPELDAILDQPDLAAPMIESTGSVGEIAAAVVSATNWS
jgi:hypothetical protein